MSENKEEEKKAPRKIIRFPEILKIDFDKPVPFRQQFAVMCTILIISCLLFTVIYVQQLFSGGVEVTNGSEESEISAASTEESETSEENDSSKSEETSQASGDNKNVVKPLKVETASEELLGEMTFVIKDYAELHDGSLILVNKDYSCRYDGENVDPIFSTKSSSYVIFDNSVSLEQNAASSLNYLMDDFAEKYGDTDIMIACGYRSYEDQVGLYNGEVQNVGSSEADKWVAPPGYSEHQTGFALDLDLNAEGINGINFDGNGNYSWLTEHCSEYGFVIRYIQGKEDITGFSYEPWHLRYVGIPHSLYITQSGIVLEEYIEFVHKYDVSKPLLLEKDEENRWCVYYVPAGDNDEINVPVPVGYEYEISGDNYSGFIVTVKL